jgi:predicted O-methyltransferase YrrM
VVISELRKLMDEVPGWLTYEEGETLYRLASKCSGRGVIVEIGSWRGKSTTCLGLGSKAGNSVRIFSVDRHTDGTFPDFQRNIVKGGVADLITPIRGRSQDVASEFDEPIELLFIDGAHQYELVKQDFDRWVPKVVEGGVVAMHDTTWFEGPKLVADERLFKSHDFKDARFVFSSLSLGTKVAENSAGDRVKNRYALLVKRSVELARRAQRSKGVTRRLERVGRRVLRVLQ